MSIYLLSTYFVISTRKCCSLISHLITFCEEYTSIKSVLEIKKKGSWMVKWSQAEEFMFKFRNTDSTACDSNYH